MFLIFIFISFMCFWDDNIQNLVILMLFFLSLIYIRLLLKNNEKKNA